MKGFSRSAREFSQEVRLSSIVPEAIDTVLRRIALGVYGISHTVAPASFFYSSEKVKLLPLIHLGNAVFLSVFTLF